MGALREWQHTAARAVIALERIAAALERIAVASSSSRNCDPPERDHSRTWERAEP